MELGECLQGNKNGEGKVGNQKVKGSYQQASDVFQETQWAYKEDL